LPVAAIPLLDNTDQVQEVLLGGVLLNKRWMLTKSARIFRFCNARFMASHWCILTPRRQPSVRWP